VREFKSFTHELRALADWLEACRIDTVAMESTGVYWIPLYEILEERGIEVLLVNAHHVKGVPGRKTDVLDCQWIQQLHTFGLLRGSFRPDAPVTALRCLVRHRDQLVEAAASYVQRMQKALVLMNLQLHNVISDVTGVTGIAILRDIVAGETDPSVLARHRHPRCKASEAEIAASLTGHYRDEHLFVLRQALELYDLCQEKIRSCDEQIEARIRALEATCDPPGTLLPKSRRTPNRSANEPSFEIRSPLFTVCGGVDLTELPGIGPYAALKLLSEIGLDMARWPSEKHFAAWLSVAPRNQISGGKVLSSRTQPSANRAAKILRMAAMSLGRSDHALGAFYRRMGARVGKA
jgi:transposase